MGEPILEARAVAFSYGFARSERRVFDGLDLSIETGDFVGILGPNGSGKTTLLKLFAGLLAPASGEVRFSGRRLAEVPPRERARDVAFVPPEAPIDAPFTVLEAALMGRFPRQGPFPFDTEEDVGVARRALERVDARRFESRFLFELSAGERQRVLVARALAQEPRVMLLDEPTSHLDLAHQTATYALLGELRRESHLTIVVVSHDLNLAATHCERLVLLDDGRVACAGAPAAVLRREILEPVYRTSIQIGTHPTTHTPWVYPA
jgi:cobalamin transport system ATP-binding protein